MTLIKHPLGPRDVYEIKIAHKTGAHEGALTDAEKVKLTFKVRQKLRERRNPGPGGAEKEE